jgi:hypothetical protein
MRPADSKRPHPYAADHFFSAQYNVNYLLKKVSAGLQSLFMLGFFYMFRTPPRPNAPGVRQLTFGFVISNKRAIEKDSKQSAYNHYPKCNATSRTMRVYFLLKFSWSGLENHIEASHNE